MDTACDIANLRRRLKQGKHTQRYGIAVMDTACDIANVRRRLKQGQHT